MSIRLRKRLKLKNEINVVPYIDVMLVLLIIFMVTAPLLNLGVDIELPQSDAKPLEQHKDEPVMVDVTADGRLFLTLRDAEPEEIEAGVLEAKVRAFVGQNPTTPVFIRADATVDYGTVYQAMTVLQQAGVPRVGMVSQPVKDAR